MCRSVGQIFHSILPLPTQQWWVPDGTKNWEIVKLQKNGLKSPQRRWDRIRENSNTRGVNCKVCWTHGDIRLFIDRRGYSSVNIVIGVVAVGFFFRRYGWHALQQNLAIASSSNFLCLFSNSRRSSDRTNKWPLRMTLMCDLDLSVLSYFEPWLCSCWTKHLQIFTECSLGYGHLQMPKYP